MTIVANQGPYITYGQAAVPPGGTGLGVAQDSNSHPGPSLFYQGLGILDPRYPFTYQPGNPNSKAYGWYGTTKIPVLDVVPATAAVGAIAAAAHVVGGTPMTLVSTSGNGILVGQSVVNASTGVNVTGLLAMGTAGGAVSFPIQSWTFTVTSANATVGATYTNNGVTFTVLATIASGTTLTASVSGGGSPTNAASNTLTKVTGTGDSTITFSNAVPNTFSGNNIWDPTKMLARAVGITAAAGASGTVVFTVKGYDVYGYPMSEAITAAANTQTVGKKAWKYIASVTPATTDAQNYSVDTTDIYGFMLRADSFAYIDAFFGSPATPANNLITTATNFVAADTTTPATTTTGDVRGTLTGTTADGTKRLTIFVTPSVANIGSTVGLVGVTQV